MTQQGNGDITEEMPPVANEQSIDEILNNIKTAIKGPAQDDDVLVLTDKVEESASANMQDLVESPSNANDAVQASPDILDEIDASFEAAMAEQLGDSKSKTGDTSIEPKADIEVQESMQEKSVESEWQMSQNADAQEVVNEAIMPAANDGLIDKATKDTVQTIMSSLYKAKGKESRHADFRSGVTMEDLVMEILRPELKAWMGQHIADIIGKAVDKEIKKIMADE